MPSFTIIALLAFFTAAPSLALWPQPQKVTNGTTIMKLASDFKISPPDGTAPQDLQDAINRTLTFLQSDKLEDLIPDSGASGHYIAP